MSVLTKSEIEKLIHLDKMITGFDNLTDQLQPNGFDLRVDNIYQYNDIGFVGKKDKKIPLLNKIDIHTIDSYTVNDKSYAQFDKNNEYFLSHGTYSFDIAETVNLPLDVCAFTVQRSSIMRCGCITNVGWWDSGYNGKGFSQLIVNNPFGFRIEKGAKIIQMIFLKNTKITDGYNGQYQHEGVN